MKGAEDERVKQVLVGAGILLVLALLVPSALLGWRLVPGLWGEWLGTAMGFLTTPFVMETSFVLLGSFLVIAINQRRRRLEGDDFVYLEQVNEEDAPRDLPDHARWAVYKDLPEDVVGLTLLEKVEGALAIGDVELASQWMSEMSQEELKEEGVMEVRIRLAGVTGKVELQARLERELELLRETKI